MPLLQDGDLLVWDTLAIAEYLAERFPEHGLWPRSVAARARARSICAEMHSGFGQLRSHCPMNIEAALPGTGALIWRDKPGVRSDVARLVAMWQELLREHGGPMLFGDFCVADAYYAPICMRLKTYALPVPPVIAAYVARVCALPGVQAWVNEALTEDDFLAFEEPYRLQRSAALPALAPSVTPQQLAAALSSNPAPAPVRSLRPWGWYEVLAEAPGYKVKRIGVAPGQRLSLQKHQHRAEHWMGLLGCARVTVGERSLDLLPGQPSAQDVHDVLARHYAGSEWISVLPTTGEQKIDAVSLANTSRMELRVFANQAANDGFAHAVLVARLDNLGKGASGAAVQNMRLMLGL